MGTTTTDPYFIFQTSAMRKLYSDVKKFAISDAPVFLIGETGTGKEVFAKNIYELSERRNAPYITINCAAIPTELMESHLFGSVKGAYTSSKEDTLGYLREANGGTIFFDEISEMSLPAQSKLLRALQEKRFRPVGAKKDAQSEFRIIASTNRTIEEVLSNHILRSDLYFRINTFEVNLPPLRERNEDVLPLANFMLSELTKKYNKRIEGFDREVSDFLQGFAWPGNIRELHSCIEYAVAISEEDIIKMPDLKFKYSSKPFLESTQGNGLLQINEREIILKAVAQTRTKKEAAQRLGISRYTLYLKLEEIKKGTFGKSKTQLPATS